MKTRRSILLYFLVFAVFIGLLGVTSCKRAKVADPEVIGPAGFRIILSGKADPSTLYIPQSQPPVFSNLTVTALDNQGRPVSGKQVVFQDYGFGYFENYEISTVRTTDASGVVHMTYFIPPGSPVKAQLRTYIEVTMVDDGRLDSASGQIRDSIPIILIPYMTEGIMLHGHILTPAGNGVGEIPVQLADGDNNILAMTVTRPSGSYEFYVGSGWYGSITPTSDAYTFAPPQYVFLETNPVYLDRDGLDFVAYFEGGNTLSVSPDTWDDVPVPGGSIVVNVVNSTGDSSINYVVVPDSDWLTVNPSTGSTPGSFTLVADENTTGKDRQGSVLVSATSTVSDSTTISVNQLGTDVSTEAVLAATPSSLYVENTGTELLTGELVVNVYNSTTDEPISYNIIPSDTWFQVSDDSGTTNNSFTVAVDINDKGATRKGTIVLQPTSTGNLKSVTIPITQAAGPTLAVDISKKSVSAVGEVFNVWITNDTAPDAVLRYKLSNSDSWLSASPEVGSVPAQISVNISANATGLARTGVLLITAYWYYDPQDPPNPDTTPDPFDEAAKHIILQTTVTVEQSE